MNLKYPNFGQIYLKHGIGGEWGGGYLCNHYKVVALGLLDCLGFVFRAKDCFRFCLRI